MTSRKPRKMTERRNNLSIASLASALLLPLLLLTLLLLSQPDSARALKLPSLFTWWQPTSQVATPLPATAPNGPTKFLAPSDEPLMTSASSGAFEHSATATGKAATGVKQQHQPQQAQQQQQLSGLSSARKPFQHMLMLPGKHNHLFSALPKSIFGRLLASNNQQQQQQSTQAPLNQQVQQSTWLSSSTRPLPVHFNPEPLAFAQQQADEQRFAKHQQQQFRRPQVQVQPMHHFPAQHQHPFQFQAQFQQPREQVNNHLNGQVPFVPQSGGGGGDFSAAEEQQKKHALGFGESEDFMILDPTHLANHQEQQQVEQQSYLQSAGESSGAQDDRHPEQLQQQQFQEVPALLISEQADNQASPVTEQQEPAGGSRFVSETATNQTATVAGKGAPISEAAESAGSESNKQNLTTSAGSESRIEVSAPPSEQPTSTSLQSGKVEVVSGTNSQENSEQQQQQRINAELGNGEFNRSSTVQPPGEQSNSSSILTSLINDELTKLKREPEVLNKTLTAMTQPLVELFLDSAAPSAQVNESSTTQQQQVPSTTTTEPQSQQQQQQQQQRPLENPDSGQLESSSAAIIVSPGEGALDGSGRMVEDQLSALSDDQIESFIIGPYKGLTSDNLSPSAPVAGNMLAAAAEQQAIRDQFRDDHHHHHQQQQQQVNRQQPFRSHNVAQSVLANFQAAQGGGLGMSSMASNLIQQAKSLIQIPFAHLANSHQVVGGSNNGAAFRGQQQVSAVAAAGSSRNREPLLDQSSSPLVSFRQEQQLANNHYNNYRQPFYKLQQSQQSTWPPVNNQQASLQQQHPNQVAFPPPTRTTASSSVATDSRYFLRPSSTISHTARRPAPQQQHQHLAKQQQQQQPTGNRNQQVPAATAQIITPHVPYFVDHHQSMSREPQRHHVNLAQQLQFLSQPVDFHQSAQPAQQVAAAAATAENGLHLYSTHATAKKSHPINELAQQQQQRQRQLATQQSDFHLVINHNNAAQQRPAFYLEQQQQQPPHQQVQVNQPQQQLQVNEQSAESAAARKYRSGLYQIDPPKLSQTAAKLSEPSGNSLEQQQVSDADIESDEVVKGNGAKQESAGKDSNADDDDDNDEQDDDRDQQATTEQQPADNNQPSGSDFVSRQVGATIGVSPSSSSSGGLFNKTRKGQVFNEPLKISDTPVPDGTNLTQVKKLKFTEDVTLYDFEVPSPASQVAPQPPSSAPLDANPSASGLNSAQQQPAVSLLDTQVYTVPYTFSLQPGGRAQLAPPQTATTYHQPPVAFNQVQQHPHHLQTQPQLQQQQVMLDRYQPTQRQVIHQAPFASFANAQVGRFPLQYLAPPSPQQPYLAPETNQQQPAQDYRSAQSSFKTMFQDFGLNQVVAPTTALPTATYDWRPPHLQHQQVQQVEQQVRAPGQVVENDAARQHYFHYQPVATVSPPARFQQEQQPQVAQVDETQRQPLPSAEQQSFFESQSPPQQQQFVLAIRHGSDQVAPNGASLFANSFTGAQQQQQQTPAAQVQSASLDNQLSANQEPDFSGFSQSNATESNTLPRLSQLTSSTTEQSPATTGNQLQQDQVLTGSVSNNNDDSDENLRQQSSGRKQTAVLVGSSPSAFCADRLPGLYADESQRCRAYYQCAPTGHQMFRCNNQTQFNQKTQNCDWWYNVNCGGRLGSLNDFEQAPVTRSSLSNEQSRPSGGGDSSSGQQVDREAAASSSQESQTGGRSESQALQQQQQQQPISLLILADEQAVRDVEEQQAAKSENRWSASKHQQEQQQQQQHHHQQQQHQEQQPEADVFHHSDSLTNITVAPESSSPGQEQLQQQQVAAPNSTPSYSRQGDSQESASDKHVEFAERSVATQDPLTGSSEPTSISLVSGSSSSSQQAPPVGDQQRQESQPQVGAFLSGGDEQSSASSSAAPSAEGGAQTSSTISDQTTTTTTTTTTTANNSSATSTPGEQVSSSSPESGQPSGSASQNAADEAAASRSQQPEQQQQQQEPEGKRRVVQSEFGLGVKQGAKSARSTARFQFTRQQHPLAADPAAQAEQVGVAPASQHPNHKYALEHQQQLYQQLASGEQQQLYSTSANQGSVSYVPNNEEHFRLGEQLQVQQQQQQVAESPAEGVAQRRAEKRFGARLPGKVNVVDLTKQPKQNQQQQQKQQSVKVVQSSRR